MCQRSRKEWEIDFDWALYRKCSLGGVIVGPIIVASNSQAIRYNAEVSGVDRCLENRGFMRRDLTEKELNALNRADQPARRTILNHLIDRGVSVMFYPYLSCQYVVL